jgi:MinD-like ATPase involved in chromosome partitioning or flagellar assembly/DNA-binding NarL/FixJ family response regulator
MVMSYKVVLVGAPGWLRTAAGTLRSPELRVAGSFSDPEQAMRMLPELIPDVLLVDSGMADAMEVGSRLARACPEAVSLLCVSRYDPDVWRNARVFGLRGTVISPPDPQEVMDALNQAREEEVRRAPAVSRRAGGEEEEEDRQVPPRGAAVVARQEVVCVWSPKGGVGKTTLAVNLAAACMGGALKLRSCVTEFDPCGKLQAALQLREECLTVSDLASGKVSYEDAQVARHSSGLYALPGPRKLLGGELGDDKTARVLLDWLKRRFDVVVIDCGIQLDDMVAVAMEVADRVLLVTTLDVVSLRLLNEAEKYVVAVAEDPGKCSVVINMVSKRPDLPLRRVPDLVPFPVAARVPDDPGVRACQNQGEVPVVSRPDSPFSHEIRVLAGQVAPAVAVGVQRRGLFGLFRR